MGESIVKKLLEIKEKIEFLKEEKDKIDDLIKCLEEEEFNLTNEYEIERNKIRRF